MVKEEVGILIGQRLKDLRRGRSIKQEDLATVLGVKKATISHYETGKAEPSDKIKIEIARFFNVSLDYLLGLIDEAIPHYQPQIFIKLPQYIKNDERELIEKFIKAIDHLNNSIAQAN